MSLCHKCRSICIPVQDGTAGGSVDASDQHGEGKQHSEDGGDLGVVRRIVVRHASAGSLAESVAEGCVICGPVWESLREEQRNVVGGGDNGDGNADESGLEVGNGDEAGVKAGVEAGNEMLEGIEYALSMRCSVSDDESGGIHQKDKNCHTEEGGEESKSEQASSSSYTNTREPSCEDDLDRVEVSGKVKQHDIKTLALPCPSFPSPESVDLNATSVDFESSKAITTASGQLDISNTNEISDSESESTRTRYDLLTPKTPTIEDLIDALNATNEVDDAPPKVTINDSQHQHRRHYPERRQQCTYNEWRERRLREMQASDPAWQQKRHYCRLVEEDLRRQWKKVPENPMIQAQLHEYSSSQSDDGEEEDDDDDDLVRAVLDKAEKSNGILGLK